MLKQSVLTSLLAFSFSAFSNGIKYVEYNNNRIPNIVTAAGIATEIRFEEDEKIVYSTFGQNDIWSSEIVKDHILVFKAKAPQPETNLIVHTNKRDYIFTITVGKDDWKKHPNNSGAYYAMRMTYRDKKSMANLKAQKAAKEAQEKQEILRNRKISLDNPTVYSNYDYRATPNAIDILPLRAWDNGKVTFVLFGKGVKRGVAYELNNGKTSLVNQHTEKNGLLVIHGVYRNLILRLGKQAVELRRNEQYGQTENNAKTNVDNTLRTIDNNAPSDFVIPVPQEEIKEISPFVGNAESEPGE